MYYQNSIASSHIILHGITVAYAIHLEVWISQ